MILRSTDRGTTWTEWAELHDPTPNRQIVHPSICVAEGAVDRVFVSYVWQPTSHLDTEVHVAWSPLDLAAGDFSEDTILVTVDGARHPCIAADDAAFSDFYVYLTWSSDIGNGGDIQFARSTDQGATWESPYTIANLIQSDRNYRNPRLAIGRGGWVHVVWALDFPLDHQYDDCLRYRRAASWADGGLAAWESMQSISSAEDLVDDLRPDIAASWTTDRVLMVSNRLLNDHDDWAYDGFESRASDDAGASWAPPTHVSGGNPGVHDLTCQESQSRWVVAEAVAWEGWGIRTAPMSAPANWSEAASFADGSPASYRHELALDPGHADRIAILGGRVEDDGTYAWLFDAEWRDDPVYPVTEPGFPVDLDSQPVSDPAVVDLDHDGDLEIVFGDLAGRIQAYHHDGEPAAGFPLDTGYLLTDSPIAVGDLNGDGDLEIVAGSTTGEVLVYDHTGQWYPDTWWYGNPGTPLVHDPAIGDIDGDGRAEVAFTMASMLVMAEFGDDTTIEGHGLNAPASGPVSMADLDLDGDADVVVPTVDGKLHVIDHDDVHFPGSWPASVHDGPLNGVALASYLGTAEPEIAASAPDLPVTVLHATGAVAGGFPVATDGWPVHGLPIIGEVEGSNDIIVGAHGAKAWSWSNVGQVNAGWPKPMGADISRTPAYGDLDQDGSAEIVFLTTDQLWVVDVNNEPSSGHRLWAMAGHDHERSGCADCPHDVRGRRVALVARQEVPAGHHQFAWHGRDRSGRPVPSGQYLARLSVRGAGLNEELTRKITVLH